MTARAVPVTLLVGNPRAGSRTLSLATGFTDSLASALAERGVEIGSPRLVDLAELAPYLLSPAGAERATEALAAVRAPGLLVVASPTYKGSYTGLLKAFFDLLPPNGLATVVAVPVMTAASSEHRHIVELHLRALLVELGAMVPVAGLSVLEAEFGDPPTVLPERWIRCVPVLAAVLGRPDTSMGKADGAASRREVPGPALLSGQLPTFVKGTKS